MIPSLGSEDDSLPLESVPDSLDTSIPPLQWAVYLSLLYRGSDSPEAVFQTLSEMLENDLIEVEVVGDGIERITGSGVIFALQAAVRDGLAAKQAEQWLRAASFKVRIPASDYPNADCEPRTNPGRKPKTQGRPGLSAQSRTYVNVFMGRRQRMGISAPSTGLSRARHGVSLGQPQDRAQGLRGQVQRPRRQRQAQRLPQASIWLSLPQQTSTFL